MDGNSQVVFETYQKDLIQIGQNEGIFELETDDLIDPSSNEDPKAQRWKSDQFKDQLKVFMSENYQKEISRIPNRFAELFYMKQYLTSIKDSKSLWMCDKVMLHPNLTINDEEYLNQMMYRMYGYIYGSYSVCTLMIYGGYKLNQNFKTMIQSKPKQGALFIVLSPFIVMQLNQHLVCPSYSDYQMKSAGLQYKYGLDKFVYNL